jgi:hypothetical protein
VVLFQHAIVGIEEGMRDRRFVSAHRGGPLKREQHYQLMEWACTCSEHVLPLFGERIDERLLKALVVARAWKEGKATVGEARKVSMAAIRVAGESTDATATAVARAVGHAAATAHMADHSLVPAWYALKAVRSAGKSIDEERKWQDRQLPEEVRGLILAARKSRNIQLCFDKAE